MEIKKPDDIVRKWLEEVAEKVDLSEGNDLTKQLIWNVPRARGIGKTTTRGYWTIDEFCSYAVPKIPSEIDIAEKIQIKDDYQRDCKEFIYNDGTCAVCKIQQRPFTFGVDMINEIVKEVQEFYKDIQLKEKCKMANNDFNSVNKLAHDIYMLGGSFEMEIGVIGDEAGKTKIEIPSHYLNRLHVQMPTTDFDKEGCCAMTNVPKIKKVETYNNKVVKVTFLDGTFTKSVCSDNDTFDEDVGITICLMKKMLGKDGNRKYNNLIRDIHKVMDENDKKKEELKTEKSARKEKQRKVELKKAATKAKERQDQIDIQSTAMLEAMRRFHAETGDDLK